MNKKSTWAYVALGLAAMLVVMFLVYLQVATYYHVPLTSLLPFAPSTPTPIREVPTPTPSAEGVMRPNGGVAKLALQNGSPFYVVNGVFVTTPFYQGRNLRSDFVIDGDPYNARIPVYMTGPDGQMNVGKAKGSLEKEIIWTMSPTDDVKKGIRLNSPAQLRIVPYNTPGDRQTQKVLDQLIGGNWSIPEGFVFIPIMVAVVE